MARDYYRTIVFSPANAGHNWQALDLRNLTDILNNAKAGSAIDDVNEADHIVMKELGLKFGGFGSDYDIDENYQRKNGKSQTSLLVQCTTRANFAAPGALEAERLQVHVLLHVERRSDGKWIAQWYAPD